MNAKGTTISRSQTRFASMSVGQRLEWLLIVRRLTQVEAARLAKVSQPAIANLIASSSRQPSAKTLLSLALVLKTTPQFLLLGEGDPLADPETHSEDEQKLLSQFRKLESAQRSHVLAFVRLMRG